MFTFLVRSALRILDASVFHSVHPFVPFITMTNCMSQAIPCINDQKKPLSTPRWQTVGPTTVGPTTGGPTTGGSAWNCLVPPATCRGFRASTVALPSSAPAPRNENEGRSERFATVD